MTDHDSEQFYHDLRQKLQGYGSAPPETVWRGIREQVPVRKRRLRPVLWLLLVGALLVGITVGTRQWGPAVFGPGTSSPAPVAEAGQTSGRSAGATGSRAVGQPNGAAPAPAPAEPRASVTTQPDNGTGRGNSSWAKGKPAAPAAGAISSARNGPAAAAAKQAVLASVDTRGKRSARIGASRRSAESSAPAQPEEETTATAASATAAFESASATTTITATRRSSRRHARLSKQLLAATATRAAALPTRRRTSELARPASLDPSRTVAAGAGSRRLGLSRTTSGRPTSTTPALAAAELGSYPSLVRPESAAATRRARARQAKVSNAPLALLVVRPRVADTPEPEVEAVKRAPRRRPTRQEISLRNWSAQLLLGSGLTYRALGGSASQLERLERPDVGFSGQASATYSLSRQLAVSVGLGYSEYATSLNYQLQKTAPDSVTRTLVRKEFRDVYRFLTIPLQAQLTLAGNPRWRYGVQGGGTVALLADAKTTEGSACNCQQVQWSSSARTQPFNRTSVMLTGGAFASYQFALGQWFTIRPQGQIFLNSLSTAASGRAPRRPWSLGVQAGYSWDLDPRKH